MPADRASHHLSERQQSVLDAVVDLVLAEGFRTLGLDEIASRAQCSKSTLYTLADSKSGLVARCVEHYFRRAARRVEEKVRRRRTAANRLRAYLMAVAEELETASEAFLTDVATNEITRRSYERHTWIAAERVRDLVEEGVHSGDFDPVHARFLGEVTAAAMDAIERGGITARTGLSHGQAYSELARLVLSTLGVGSTVTKPG
ncbi:MAG TPA: TetR/AcrR family transcriptional regulator [Pseudonocardiaceae bacterium]|nr:TetR/AcrR family transcriptional regulator [Pseudonocardiaceae bacterium]